MSRHGSAGSTALRTGLLALAVMTATVVFSSAQEIVTVVVPVAVSFSVTDVSVITTGSPSPTTISFSSAALTIGKALRISVQADASAFTSPGGGTTIPASKGSWNALGASGGVGWNGTLSATSDGLVYQSNPSPTSGQVDLEFTLGAPGNGLRAGTHQLTIRWKFESITP
jgi:hypothetical protein